MIAWAFTFEIGLQFVVIRATLLCADPAHPRGMAAVAASEEKVAYYISKLGIEGRVAIAVYNGPESHIPSGEMKAIKKLISVVKADGLQATKLVVDQGELILPFLKFSLIICQASIVPPLCLLFLLYKHGWMSMKIHLMHWKSHSSPLCMEKRLRNMSILNQSTG